MNNTRKWNDFNTADPQQEFALLPAGTIAPVRMSIKPGGYNDLANNWDGGYATQNQITGSVYLSCEFTILEGEFAKRKVWGLIGLHSPKGQTWQNMGRSFIRGVLSSAYGLSDKDDSPIAQQRRRIEQLCELDGLCFVAKITVKKDEQGNQRNQIDCAITPDNKQYQTYAGCLAQQPGMTSTSTSTPTATAIPTVAATAPNQDTAATAPSVPTSRPHWAQ